MKKEKIMDVVFLLDRSGSMRGSETDTIGGYNTYLEKQQKNKIKTLITTVLFDNQYEILNNRKDINETKKLTDEEYFVRGSTALLDAIGTTINNLDKKIKNKNHKLLFVITTDGLENASTKYNKEQIKELIEGHKNWEFIYIGANIDSFKEASSIGIREKNIANYTKDNIGVAKMFKSINNATEYLRENLCLDESWKDELENSL